jgi:hypothetical protein
LHDAAFVATQDQARGDLGKLFCKLLADPMPASVKPYITTPE